jgi:diguanylate cyclase (GGDEF)-like protein
MLININNLENIKSIYNEQTINLILEHLGNCFRTALRSNDLLFRYDDSRILAILTTFKLKTDLLIIAERVEDQIAIPFHAKDAEIHLQAAIGIAMFPEDGDTPETLQNNAASALAQAMEDGKPWLMFNPRIQQRASDRLYLRSGLSNAVKHNELELRYMTLVDANGKPQGLEALVRWRHPSRGILGPDVFLPVAIHSRIIGALTRWVLYRIVQDWVDKLHHFDLFITLNLSAIDFGDSYVVETITSAIQNRMPASRLKVEITESECIHNLETTIDIMHKLRLAGIEVLIDDFGVGNSSLAYLKDLPARYAKIDRSFVANIANSPQEQEFLRHIIALAKVWGIDILVEGIETAKQFDILRHCGAVLFQGYQFGEAMPVDAIGRLMESIGRYIPGDHV